MTASQKPASPPGKPSDFRSHPSFSFVHNTAKGYTLADAVRKDRLLAKNLLAKFQQWGRMTKGLILQAPRKGAGTETIPQRSIKPSIPSTVPNIVTLLSVRLSEKARMLGYWDKESIAVFQIVFIDPDHSLY